MKVEAKSQKTYHFEYLDKIIPIVLQKTTSAPSFSKFVEKLDCDMILLITDSNVDKLYADSVVKYLKRKWPVKKIVMPAGEKSKTFEALEQLCEKALEVQITRSSIICALGGGMIGNLSGVAASLLFRGIRFFHLPTSLVAQIDSSLGIKQAINSTKNKNSFGSYYPPEFVDVQTCFLRTLPEREWYSGTTECVKHALCQDAKFMKWIAETGPFNWEKSNLNDIYYLIERTIELKMECLYSDPTEGKREPMLELGHTVGHALEILSEGKLRHGEAVSIGMVLECKVSCDLGLMKKETLEKIINYLHSCGLNTEIPNRLKDKITIDAMINAMRYDNKRKTNAIVLTLLEDIGRFARDNGKIGIKTPPALLKKSLNGYFKK